MFLILNQYHETFPSILLQVPYAKLVDILNPLYERGPDIREELLTLRGSFVRRSLLSTVHLILGYII